MSLRKPQVVRGLRRHKPLMENLEGRTLFAVGDVISVLSDISTNNVDAQSTIQLGTSALNGPAGFDQLDVRNLTNSPVTIKAISVPAGFKASLSNAAQDGSVVLADTNADAFISLSVDTKVAGSRSGPLTFQVLSDSGTDTFTTTVSAVVAGVVPNEAIATAAFGAPGSSVVLSNQITGSTEGNALSKVTSASDFRLYSFTLPSATNALKISLSAVVTNPDSQLISTDVIGNLHLGVYRDTSGNGKLDLAEINAGNLSPINLTDLRKGSSPLVTAMPTLAAGNYFLEVLGEGLDDINVRSTNFDYTLKLANTTQPTSPKPHISTTGNFEFGNVNLNEDDTGTRKTVVLKNDGTATLTLGAVTTPAGFVLVHALPTTLAAGASDTLTFRVDTRHSGVKSGNVSITTNASPVSLALHATVFGPPTAAMNAPSRVTKAGQQSILKVVYKNGAGVKLSTIGATDLVLKSGNKKLKLKLMAVTPKTNAATITATYLVLGGGAHAALRAKENGTWSVYLKAGEVAGVLGLKAAGKLLGKLVIKI